MKQPMHDERALRGAAEEGAKAYLWAMALLSVLLALKALSLVHGRCTWPGLAMEVLAIPTGAALVLERRIRFGLWGRLDEPLTELLQSARSRAFEWMHLLCTAVMLLGIVFDPVNRALHQMSGCIMLLVNSHRHSVCVREGYHHGLVTRPQQGRKDLLKMLVVFALLAGIILGAHWLMEHKLPEVWEIMLVAILAVSAVRGAHKEYRASEQAADEVLRGAERRAERSGDDGE